MITHLILLCSSALCFIVGLCKYFGRRKAFFCTLISAAMGCFMMEHLCETIFLLVPGEIPEHFHVGMLARVGGFSFLFSASYAQMDGLVDDRSPSLRIYRLLSLAAPLLIFFICLPVLLSGLPLIQKITTAVLMACAAFPAYYHLKHILIPDVSMGIIASIRGYSALALLLEIASAGFMAADKLEKGTLMLITGVVLAAAYPGAFFAMEKGRKKWTI